MRPRLISRQKSKELRRRGVSFILLMVAVGLQTGMLPQVPAVSPKGSLPIDSPRQASYQKPLFTLPRYASRRDDQLETVVKLAGGGEVHIIYGPDATGGENLKRLMYQGFLKIPAKSCASQHWVMGVQSSGQDFGTYQTFIRSFWRKGEYLMMVITAPVDPKATNREEADLKLITSTIHHYSEKSAKK